MDNDMMSKDLVETASRVLEQLNAPVCKKEKATIYLSPIESVTPITLPLAHRLILSNAISGLLSRLGYNVSSESLMDDSPQLVKALSVSVWLRYLELCGEQVCYPKECYQGDYIFDFAASVHRNYGNYWGNHWGNRWAEAANEVIHSSSPNLDGGQSMVNEMYERLLQSIGEEGISVFAQTGIEAIAQDINNDLHDLSVCFDSTSTGSELIANGMVEKTIADLQAKGLVRSEGGKQYLNLPATAEVLLLENDEPSAFCLHLVHALMACQKENDLFIWIYDIDQEKPIQRIKHCAVALGRDSSKWLDKPVKAPLLSENGDLVHTSPLSEDFVSFREARQTIGLDYLRFIFLQQKTQQCAQIELLDNPPMENWLLIKKCFACINILQDSGAEKCESSKLALEMQRLTEKSQQYFRPFFQLLSDIPNVTANTKHSLEPAVLVKYLQNLCDAYLSYYNNHMVTQENKHLRGENMDNTAMSPVDVLFTKCFVTVFKAINQMLAGQLIQERRAYDKDI